MHPFHYRRKSTVYSSARPSSVALSCERLESRWMLSGAPPESTVNLFGKELAVSSEAGETPSLLVKFRDDAFCEVGDLGCKPLRLRGELPGRWVSKGLSAVDGLREIVLRRNADIQQALEIYRSHPSVEYAEPNYQLQTTQAPNDPLYLSLWGMENFGQTGGSIDSDIDAAAAWDVTTGGNTIVAVIDTGVNYTHEDLAANMWVNPGEIPGDGVDNDANGFVDDVHGYDFANNDPDPMDDHGHGTHVAGTVGAVGNNGIGVVGVNWNAQIMAIKFLNAQGTGTNADAVRAINYAAKMGARVANASWGGNEPFSQALYDAIKNAGNQGQVFVAGAGNGNFLGFPQDNDTNPFYPASYDLPNIISVAATDHMDNRAFFSNFGATTVDLAAPGVDIRSTLHDGGYGFMSGTSMATPHVAGVAALILDQHPQWSYSQVVAQIFNTVDPVASMSGITVTGGRLNAAAALGNPVPPPAPPPSGTLPLVEDFEDGDAEYFQPWVGGWSIVDGRYRAIPDATAVATVRISDPLPSNLSLKATVNGQDAQSGLYTNAFVIFDYQHPNNFKFAGPKFGTDEWVIGHRSGKNWITDASISEPIDTLTDYELEVVIEQGKRVTLMANGVAKVAVNFSGSLIDGSVGVATWNAEAYFDDFVAQPYVPPPPGPPGSLPIDEDFDDSVADHFRVESGIWSVNAGRYETLPNGDTVSIVQITDPLPQDVEMRATLNGKAAVGNYYGNAFLIFDYQGPTDFKFAGFFLSTGKWAIGHRTSSTWVRDAELDEPMSPDTDYVVQLLIEDGQEATLVVDGVPKVTHTFQSSIVDGELGLGTWNAFSKFDDLVIAPYSPPSVPMATLPATEDFDDGVADYFDDQTGTWTVVNQRYRAEGAGSAIATLRIEDALPASYEIRSTINADAATGGLYSNGFVVFDYQDETDFKFAGVQVAAGKWVVGHHSASSWVIDASFSEPIFAGFDYSVQAILQGTTVTLLVNGIEKVTHAFSDPLNDGLVGLATWNANASFDDVVVQAYVPQTPPSADLPVHEDFEDGTADYFEPKSGLWQVNAGRYEAIAISDAVATLRTSAPLPANVEVAAIVSAQPPSGSLYGNAFVIFDYQGPTNFKFAGASIGAGTWTIGQRSGSSWSTLASAPASISGNTDYNLRVTIEENGTVTLLVDDVPQVSHVFSESLTDGALGLGNWNAISKFDDVTVGELEVPTGPPVASLPVVEDFADGVADYFDVQTGIWDVSAGRYQATPTGDAISTLRIEQPLPADLELEAIVNANPVSGSFYSNAFLVFDYQSPTDFKFAGASVGAGKWTIGQRSGTKWTTLASASGTVNAETDYLVQVVIRNDSQVTLYVDGAPQTSFNFSAPVNDGGVGLATWNAFSQFDNVAVRPHISGVGLAAASLSAVGPDAERTPIRMASRLLPLRVDAVFAETSDDASVPVAVRKWS